MTPKPRTRPLAKVADVDRLIKRLGLRFPRHMRANERDMSWVDARDYEDLLHRLATAWGVSA